MEVSGREVEGLARLQREVVEQQGRSDARIVVTVFLAQSPGPSRLTVVNRFEASDRIGCVEGTSIQISERVFAVLLHEIGELLSTEASEVVDSGAVWAESA